MIANHGFIMQIGGAAAGGGDVLVFFSSNPLDNGSYTPPRTSPSEFLILIFEGRPFIKELGFYCKNMQTK